MGGIVFDGDVQSTRDHITIAVSHVVANLEVLAVFTRNGQIDHRGILYGEVFACCGVKRQRDDGDITLENQQVVAIGLIGKAVGCTVGKPGDEASIGAVAVA